MCRSSLWLVVLSVLGKLRVSYMLTGRRVLFMTPVYQWKMSAMNRYMDRHLCSRPVNTGNVYQPLHSCSISRRYWILRILYTNFAERVVWWFSDAFWVQIIISRPYWIFLAIWNHGPEHISTILTGWSNSWPNCSLRSISHQL